MALARWLPLLALAGPSVSAETVLVFFARGGLGPWERLPLLWSRAIASCSATLGLPRAALLAAPLPGSRAPCRWLDALEMLSFPLWLPLGCPRDR